MRTCALLLVASSLAGCAADQPSDDDWADADPGDFDSKADGISGSSQAVLDFIDGAHDRLLAQIPTLTDKTLLTHLKNASLRGVDVHAYLAVPHPGHPSTVLAAEQLEAAGVDITVQRTNQLAGFLAIADDKMLVKSGSSFKTTTTGVADKATSFMQVIAEDTSGSPPALGSDSTALFVMPDSQVGPIVSLIAGAKTSIDLEIYQLQSPAVVGALVAAEQRGVAVRVMLEPKTVGFANFKQMSALLSAAHVDVKATPPDFDSSHNVDHAKFMMIDGKELLYGSGNLVRSGTGGNSATEFDNRDFWIRDRRTTSVSEGKKLFEADWARSSTASVTWHALVVTPDNAAESIVGLVKNAQQRVYLYNQSLSDQDTLDALVAAKQRGVDVRVLLGDQPGFAGAPPLNQPAIDQLTAAGIPAAYFTTHYLHGKVIVGDDAAFVGSQNFTKGGLQTNRELGEILASSPIVDALAKLFEADQANPTP